MQPTAIPVHVIVRYALSSTGSWKGWRPVIVHRYRLFKNATHEEVTGQTGGANWDHDWSCETLEEESSRWHINGRQTWATFDAAIAELSSDYLFATFEEALAAARERAANNIQSLERRIKEARCSLQVIDTATPPKLPYTIENW